MPKRKYLVNELRGGRWVRAWAEGRGRNKEFSIQVWNCGKPEGDPDGDWGMPGVLGLSASIDQALLQTEKT